MGKFLEVDDSTSISTRVILKFLSLILSLNNFTFNNENILQIKGCAVGSECSCLYADFFMGSFEKDHIYPLITNKHLCYYCLVNDIFMIWLGSEQELNDFFAKLNSRHTTIKFECKYFKIQINFLDTKVCINKSTDRNAYLHYNSCHPQKLKDNIPYGQFL